MGFEEVTDVGIKTRDVSCINMILVGIIIVDIRIHESLFIMVGFYYHVVASPTGKLKED